MPPPNYYYQQPATSPPPPPPPPPAPGAGYFPHTYYPLNYFPGTYFCPTSTSPPPPPPPPPPTSGTRPQHNITMTNVGASAVQIIFMPVSGVGIPISVGIPVTIIQNQGANDVYFGPSSVTNGGGSNPGIVLKGGKTPPDQIQLPFCGATWAIAAAGSSVIVVDQVY